MLYLKHTDRNPDMKKLSKLLNHKQEVTKAYRANCTKDLQKFFADVERSHEEDRGDGKIIALTYNQMVKLSNAYDVNPNTEDFPFLEKATEIMLSPDWI